MSALNDLLWLLNSLAKSQNLQGFLLCLYIGLVWDGIFLAIRPPSTCKSCWKRNRYGLKELLLVQDFDGEFFPQAWVSGLAKLSKFPVKTFPGFSAIADNTDHGSIGKKLGSLKAGHPIKRMRTRLAA